MTTDVFHLILGCTNARQLHLVLESGCDVNARNERKETPLMVCVSHLENAEKRKSILRTLLYFGADVNARNGRGQTPLMYSCILDQIETVVILLHQKNIDVNIQDREGNTALMYACSLGNAMTVKILLNVHVSGQHRFDLAATDKEGLTCLQKAIEGRYASVVALLSRAQKSEMKKHYYSSEGNLRNVKSNNNSNIRAPKSGRREQQSRPKSGFQSYMSDVKDSTSNESLNAFVSGNMLHNRVKSGLSGAESCGRLSRKGSRATSRTPRPPSVDPRQLEREHTFISEDYEREGGEKVEDLVLAVRQCAADIRQICQDYDIKYTKSEDHSTTVDTKKRGAEKDDRKTKSSRSVKTREPRQAKEAVVSRKSRKSQQNKKPESEEDLAELVNRHDAHPPHMKNKQTNAKNPWPMVEESDGQQNPPVSVIITGPKDKISSSSSVSLVGSSSRERLNTSDKTGKKVFVPKFVLESRSRENIDGGSDRSEDTEVRRPKLKLSVQQLLQIPINDSSANGTSYKGFPQGRAKKTKKPLEGKKSNLFSKDIKPSLVEPRNGEQHSVDDDLRSSGMGNWSLSFSKARRSSTDSGSSGNELSLPPLRESLRMNNHTDKPLKLQSLDKDLWRIVESSGHKGQQATKR